VRWELETDLRAFDARVRPLLEARIENNVPTTILAAALQGQFDSVTPVLAVGVHGDGTVAAAALRTPPWLMLCTAIDADDAAGLLDPWLERDPELPGVIGLRETARTIAGEWTRRTGGTDQTRTAMAMHSVTDVVDPPRPGPGRLVTATAADRDVALEWWGAFVAETDVIDPVANPTSNKIYADVGYRRIAAWEERVFIPPAPDTVIPGHPPDAMPR
jgi:hypothetical protein